MTNTPPFIHYHLEIQDIEISIDEVLDLLQEPDRSPANQIVAETMEVISLLPEIIEMRGGYAIFDDIDVIRKEGIIKLNDICIKPHKRITGYMENAEKIAVFICSAGEKFTTFAENYTKEGDYLKAYIVDMLGSLAAEKAIDYILKRLEKEMWEVGMHISNSYSPGYCNWQLTDQKLLFQALPDNQCNISLTNSCLMLPIKSVSGIVGIGKNIEKKSYACEICESINCVYRKIRYKNAHH